MKIKAILISMCAAVVLLSCRPGSDAGTDTPSFWMLVATGVQGPGPRTYVSRNPILLPDGTHVVCVAILKALWCKEAASQ